MDSIVKLIVEYRLNNFRNFFIYFLAENFYENERLMENETDFKLNWIYGIKLDPIKNPIKYLIGENSYNSINSNGKKKKFKFSKNFHFPEILIYSIGKIIIIYNHLIKKQMYYNSHEVNIKFNYLIFLFI